MQKNNITILSTGALEKEFVDIAFDLDIIVETIPFIATSPVATAELQKTLEPLVRQQAFVIITSSNAVEALAASLPVSPTSWAFFCIGHATGAKVRKYFAASTIAATADNAKGLVQEIVNRGLPGEMIFFCGDQRRDELPDQLRARRVIVREVVVYETIPTPQKLAKHYEGILFFSPSAVKSFFSLNQPGPGTVLFSIGPTTAEALEAFTKNKIIIAERPEKEEVVDKAIEYFKQ